MATLIYEKKIKNQNMKLSDLLKTVKPLTISGKTDIEIAGINIDSRKIKDGHLFVAIKGTQTDGHRFIPKAIELGATAILVEDMPEQLSEGGKVNRRCRGESRNDFLRKSLTQAEVGGRYRHKWKNHHCHIII